MGHKRKASDSLSPHSISSSPSIASPSHYNINAPQPFPSQLHTTSTHTPLPGWGSPEPYFSSGMLNSSPYSATDNNPHHLHSRTRKRFRNNRPNEEIIHQTTLSKLYAAQQRHEQRSENQDQGTPPLTPSPTPSRSSLTSASSIPNITHQQEKAQASIHAFFGGEGSSRRPSSTPLRGPDPKSSTSTPSANPTIACCEDCSAPLLLLPPTETPTTTFDTEMIDIDATPDFSISSEDEGSAFSCANCSKRVCDVCAVRGVRRVCLECANSRNGNRYGYGYTASGSGGRQGSCGMEAGNMYGYREVEEKRWVGGIGWM